MKMLIVLLILLLIALIANAAPATKRLGVASFYSDREHGRRTASGEVFDKRKLTCAMWGVPFGTRLRVTNVETRRSVVIRCSDRGPAHRLGRLIDLSEAAFERIAPLSRGLVLVEVEKIE